MPEALPQQRMNETNGPARQREKRPGGGASG